MDIEKLLHNFARSAPDTVLKDIEFTDSLEKRIRQRVFSPAPIRRYKYAYAAVGLALLLILFFQQADLVDFYERNSTHLEQSAETIRPNRTEPSVPANLFFASEFVSTVQNYLPDVSVENVSDSRFQTVFKRTNRAVTIETNRGTIDVVFFPERGEAESIQIDEEIVASGITRYTFVGASLNDRAVPIQTNGPTYIATDDNLLILTKNSELIHRLKVALYRKKVYEDVMRSFGIDQTQYEFVNFSEDRANPAVFEILRAIELKRGAVIPGIFFRKDGQEAIAVTKSMVNVNELFLLKKDGSKWKLVTSEKKQGNRIPMVD